MEKGPRNVFCTRRAVAMLFGVREGVGQWRPGSLLGGLVECFGGGGDAHRRPRDDEG